MVSKKRPALTGPHESSSQIDFYDFRNISKRKKPITLQRKKNTKGNGRRGIQTLQYFFPERQCEFHDFRNKLRGKGVKSVRSHRTGDLMCKVNVETPVNLTNFQKKLIKQLSESIDKGGNKHNPNQHGWFDSVKSFMDKLKG